MKENSLYVVIISYKWKAAKDFKNGWALVRNSYGA